MLQVLAIIVNNSFLLKTWCWSHSHQDEATWFLLHWSFQQYIHTDKEYYHLYTCTHTSKKMLKNLRWIHILLLCDFNKGNKGINIKLKLKWNCNLYFQVDNRVTRSHWKPGTYTTTHRSQRDFFRNTWWFLTAEKKSILIL